MAVQGQNFRIFLAGSEDPVAEATNCTANITTNTEDTSTKDTTGKGTTNSKASFSWQVTVDTLNVSNLNILLAAVKSGAAMHVMWDETDSDDNATTIGAAFSYEGNAFITDMTVNFNDREWSTNNVQLTGTGELAPVQHT